jgi:DNA-directed RNA polymerase specialized sigma24 family protein
MNEAFKWFGCFKPGAAEASITRKDASLHTPAPPHDPALRSNSVPHGEARSINMATSFAPVSLNPTPSTTLWGIVLLEHLDEFVTLAWYLVADGKLVEDTFSRTLAKLDTIPFEASIPALPHSQARDVLIAQAIAVVSDARIKEAGDWSVERDSIGRLPDLARLAFMLKLIIRSPEPEIANYLGVSTHEVQALVEYAIDRLSVASPVAAIRTPHQVWVSYALESRIESSTVATTNFTS